MAKVVKTVLLIVISNSPVSFVAGFQESKARVDSIDQASFAFPVNEYRRTTVVLHLWGKKQEFRQAELQLCGFATSCIYVLYLCVSPMLVAFPEQLRALAGIRPDV